MLENRQDSAVDVGFRELIQYSKQEDLKANTGLGEAYGRDVDSGILYCVC